MNWFIQNGDGEKMYFDEVCGDSRSNEGFQECCGKTVVLCEFLSSLTSCVLVYTEWLALADVSRGTEQHRKRCG